MSDFATRMKATGDRRVTTCFVHHRRPLLALFLAVVVGGMVGCAPFVGRMTKQAVEAPMDVMQEPERRRQIEEVATSPEIQAATHAMSKAVTEGVIAGVIESLDEADVNLGESSSSVIEEMRPALARTTSEVSRAAAAGMMEGIAHGLEKDVAPALSRSLRNELGPALGHTVQEDFLPALGSGIRKEVVPALIEPVQSEGFRDDLGKLTQAVSYNAVVGTDKGVQAVERRKDTGESEGLLAAFGSPMTLVALGAGLGVLLMVLLVLLIKGRSQQRYLEARNRQREEMLISVMQAFATRDMTPEERQEFMRGFAPTLADESDPPATSSDGGRLTTRPAPT